MTNSNFATEELIRSSERARLSALVDGDVGKAIDFHGREFELITPIGAVLNRDQYLGAIAAKQINYLRWEAGQIAVKLFDNSAIIRYRAALEVEFGGRPIPFAYYWHTDSYELHDGRWQAVWSHATEIR